jgi:EAL domain-containing protein (putative c-di-GMP-specific phosphodiesterase class I)/GGDEF domain-containing protein
VNAAARETVSNETTRHVAFVCRLDEFLAARRRPGAHCGLVVIHLGNLHRINTTAGYRAGQALYRRFAVALRDLLRDQDWLLPLSDDRFGVVLDDVRNAGHLVLAANRMARMATELAAHGGNGVGLDACAGAALFPQHGNSAELLLRHSELAVESARREQAAFALYRPEVSREMTEEWDLEAELRTGIENSELHLWYQPKIDARTLRPCGAEALLRWDSPQRGAVSPERFIAVAERSELIDSLSEFTLHSAARDAAEWPSSHDALHVAVNVAPATVEYGDVLGHIRRVSAIWGLDSARFTVEVTENGIISAGGAALQVLRELRSAGVRVSIDDFGTGNSSLAYFRDIPADEVKIDKSFVVGMDADDRNRRLVKSIVDLAHAFDLTVVAEGVETAEAAETLRQLGCDTLQGYHFSKPVPQEQLLKYLQEAAQATVASTPV